MELPRHESYRWMGTAHAFDIVHMMKPSQNPVHGVTSSQIKVGVKDVYLLDGGNDSQAFGL